MRYCGRLYEQLHTTSLLVMHVFQATADGTAGSDILFQLVKWVLNN